MSTDTTTPPPARHGYPPLSALRRSRSDRKLVGVAGGLGRYAGIDPLVFRILFVALTIFGGSGLLLYALGWLLVPEDGETESEGQRLFRGSSRSVLSIIAMIVILVAGLAWTGALIDSGPGFGGIGLLIVVAAAVVLLTRTGGPAATTTPGAEQPPVAPAADPGEYGQTPGTAYSAPAPSYAQTAPAYAQTAVLPPPPSGPTYPTYGPPLPPPPPPAPREKSILGRVTLSVALIVVGALIGLDIETSHDVGAQGVLAAALGVVGIGLIVGAFAGRARGLVVWGVLLTIAVTVVSFAHVPLRGGVGDRTWTPTTVAQVHSTYRLGVGDAKLDLSGVDFTGVNRQTVDVRQGAGHLNITVPSNVVVRVHGHVHGGDLIVPGQPSIHGSDLSLSTIAPAGSPAGSVVLVVDAELGVGTLEVHRA